MLFAHTFATRIPMAPSLSLSLSPFQFIAVAVSPCSVLKSSGWMALPRCDTNRTRRRSLVVCGP